MTTTGAMLVFRSNKVQPEPEFPAGVAFHVVDAIPSALGMIRAYAAAYGTGAALKMLAKVGTPSRSYYAATRDGRILSDGWISAGRCGFYQIGEEDVVIGPIHTAPEARGNGLAHACLVRAANVCLGRRAGWVYIDTTEDNFASRRTIAKSGMTPICEEDIIPPRGSKQ